MLEAVLFDWGNTLTWLDWDEELVAAGHRAALGRDDPDFTARWRTLALGRQHGYRPYEELLAELGVEDPDGFIDREHEVWRSQYAVLASAQALLESLRDRGFKTGLVANSWPDPPRVLRADAEELGLAPLLDTMVWAAEAGVRKPAPEIFLRACDELGIEPAAALFVGDDLVADVQGAAAVGMSTVQALWFRADESPEIEPDFQAFTAMDVLNIARRLAR
ncbi:MAG TPA: HAD-IA family hydrolase [Gaiellaceae bacterium]|nr:HAD-IA family hydrolase [Gaiellaceae bacterium]